MNSPLSCMRVISPFRNSPRTHKIDTITIHCVVGQASVEALCSHFQTANCSCNYAIGADGRICTIVDEGDRSWCSSNPPNDDRAITIECASDSTHPYAINQKVYDSLVKLCADICKRNGIPKLVWSTDKRTRVNHLNGCNLTVHRDYANKSCPGEYIYERLGQIAKEVNQLIKEGDDMTIEQTRQVFKEEYAKQNPTYNTIQEVPEYWRNDIQRLMELGIIKGSGGKLGLTRSEAKTAVLVKRGLSKAGLA